jgi:hypothetical protein
MFQTPMDYPAISLLMLNCTNEFTRLNDWAILDSSFCRVSMEFYNMSRLAITPIMDNSAEGRPTLLLQRLVLV